MALTSLEQGALSLLVGRVENECQRRLEPVGDFRLVREQRLVWTDDRENWGNDITRDRSVGFDFADDFGSTLAALPPTGLFLDDFETGDASRWSMISP